MNYVRAAIEMAAILLAAYVVNGDKIREAPGWVVPVVLSAMNVCLLFRGGQLERLSELRKLKTSGGFSDN